MCGFFSLSVQQFLSECGLLQNTVLKDLGEIKIANISHINFSIMVCKASFLLLNKCTFTSTDLSPKKSMKQQRKERCVLGKYLQKQELKMNSTFL